MAEIRHVHRMAQDVQASVMSAHHQHTAAIQALNEDMDDGLSKVYQLTQVELEPKNDRLDYSLVSNT